jgi:hypothetical protein
MIQRLTIANNVVALLDALQLFSFFGTFHFG